MKNKLNGRLKVSFKTEYNGVLFTYQSWEGNGGCISFHSDAIHMIALVFYNQLLSFRDDIELSDDDYRYHRKCMESHRRTVCLNSQES